MASSSGPAAGFPVLLAPLRILRRRRRREEVRKRRRGTK